MQGLVRMGHIVVGAPGIDRCHLHDRLFAALRARSHRVSVLCPDPRAAAFWRAQGQTIVPLRHYPLHASPDAVGELLASTPPDLRRRLGGAFAAMHGFFAQARPHVLLLHQDRGVTSRLLQFAARANGTAVLWTGDGLLPHTLQVDGRGLDGEASIAQRPAGDFRVVRSDRALLDACLANALARTTPFPLPQRTPKPVPWTDRWHLAWQLARDGSGLGAAWRSLWPTAAPRLVQAASTVSCADLLPNRPFVAVLLQDDDDPRLQFDAAQPPRSHELVQVVHAAAKALDPAMVVLVVTPHADTLGARFPGCAVAPASVAIDAAAMATACVTVNHPLASVALLAGTPVLHLGRALYGVRGVATPATLATLPDDLAQALAHDYPTLRQRFLSWVFGHGHVWCSPSHPAHNGMLGLVQTLENRIQQPDDDLPPLRYRPGPAWPLAPV
ncbi:MAG: hypothetical protein JNK15_10285 [Planctomycetes bacterium]|nr:hypothetical protein [Planctomycetota bacterium]